MTFVLPGKESLGSVIGRGLGEGFSKTADTLVNQKLNHLAKTQERKQFMEDVHKSGVFKDYPEIPQLLQVLEPKDRGQFLNDFLVGQARLGGFNTPQGTGAETFAPGQPGQQPQQKPTTGQILSAAKTTPATQSKAIENEKNRAFKIQQNLQPVISKYGDKFEASREAASVAQHMLDILENHGDKFPGPASAFVPEWIRNTFINTADEVREYEALANELVTLRSQARRGNPTTYKTRLEQQAKANLGQPVETQKNLLRNVLKEQRKEADLQAFIESLKDEDGNYPHDLRSRILEEENIIDNPLKYPQKFDDGTIIEHNGKQYVNIKSKHWKGM